MKRFSELIDEITNSKKEQNKSLKKFFLEEESTKDKDQALKLLLGIYPKKLASTALLKNWAAEITGFDQWLIDRCVEETGHFIKTLSLLLKPATHESYQNYSLQYWISKLIENTKQSEIEIKEYIQNEICSVDPNQRLILLQLITGTFKAPITKKVLVDTLSKILGIQESILHLRLFELEQNNTVSLEKLSHLIANEELLCPDEMTFYKNVKEISESFGDPKHWTAFGKSEGIRVQLIKYKNTIHLWSAYGEIITDKFPDILSWSERLSDNIVIEGQLIPKNSDISIDQIRSRINKKSITKKDIEKSSVELEVWDIHYKNNVSENNLARMASEGTNFIYRNEIAFSVWDELKTIHKNCRKMGYSGLQLESKKLLKNYYWKAPEYSVKAILMYVEFGGMNASGLQSMTFGVLENTIMMPIAKTDARNPAIDYAEIASFTKSNTIERFGPVRTLKPELVYELHFDSISKAPRRKSGLILNNVTIFQKIKRGLEFADSLENLKKLL